jgi:Cu/Ag efflux pump CusA
VRGAISEIDGLEDPRVQLPTEEPTIEVEADIARAEAHGLAPGHVRRAATTLLSGLVVGNLFEEQKVFDVAVWGAPEIRETEADVESLLIDTPDGSVVPLGDVAEVRVVPNPAVIRHESVDSYVDVTANVSGRSVGDVTNDIAAALEQVEFPLEHHAELLGGAAEDGATRTPALAVAAAALLGVFLLLQAASSSWRVAILLLAALPAALAGGVIAAVIMGGEITLGSAAGLIAVAGLAVRGSILLVRQYQQRRRDGEPFGAELVTGGTRDRLVPTVTTALASAAVLLPFAVRGGSVGSEIVGPMAIVMLGGLVTTTLVNLVVLPALYLRFGSVADEDVAAEDLFAGLPDVDTVGER